ncbi:MAG: methylated-DNA--[protein]-cysteine S-methyltransferase, partial [Opitutales bacterium]|nr:methylated-DNA--[protein]-cysteine S-methyltransferase [Opitutales bacterium]
MACDFLNFYTSPFGQLGLIERNQQLKAIVFLNALSQGDLSSYQISETELLQEVTRQLDAYFKGNLKYFDLPLLTEGTEFQQKVWKTLEGIPYGSTQSYGEIARKVGCIGGARAVGMAAHRNPIPIIIPCHRVIGASGKLVGYAGGLEIKQYLLDLENKYKKT